jgi:tRNA U34 5-methylaminomethyl-2-thiouridine-forming methyltransferase MnmC
MQNMVAFCSAKVAMTDATFAERKATIINSQPRRLKALSLSIDPLSEKGIRYEKPAWGASYRSS